MRSRAAFSLIEVVIAIGIFSAAAGVFIMAINSGLQAIEATQSEFETYANRRFALRQIAKITDRQTLLEGGEVELPGDELISWTAEIEPTDVLDLFKVSVKIETIGGEAVSDWDNLEPETAVLYLAKDGSWYEFPGDRDELVQRKRENLENREFY